LGDISGVIHGSALNKPGELATVSAEDALHEVSPKVLGAENICRALADTPPKLFIGFTSIIGLSGMIRNGWYGFSNEVLNLLLCQFEREHPETNVLNIAFSIWDDVGMGVRMGSTKYLARQGIDAIPAEEGVRRFLQLVMHDPGDKQVIVAARFSGLDTLKTKHFPLPFAARFLEKNIYYQPEVELVARTHLSLERDPYIKDHLWRGTYLFPTVFGLEAMAQAVGYVTGKTDFAALRIENISLKRPIPVNPEKGAEIEIHAEVLERKQNQIEQRVRVGIRTEQTGFTVEHFSATFVLNSLKTAPRKKIDLPQTSLNIRPERDLYNTWLLFQGPQYQCIKEIYSLDSKKCIFRPEPFFPSSDNNDTEKNSQSDLFLLGDPFLRDSLLHSAQLTVSPDICLPVEIRSIELYHTKKDPTKPIIGVAVVDSQIGRDYHATVFIVDEDGNVQECISGYVLKILEHYENYPTAEEIADPNKRDEAIIRKKLEKYTRELEANLPGVTVTSAVDLHKLSKKERHIKEMPFLREVIAQVGKSINIPTKGVQIKWQKSGKPYIEGSIGAEMDISLSHDGYVLLCVAGQGLQGCDVASISTRSQQEWVAILGSSKDPLLQQLIVNGDSLDQAGTRIWAAMEALRKALNSPFPTIVYHKQIDDAVLFKSNLTDKNVHVLTFPIQLARGPRKIVAFVVQRFTNQKVTVTSQTKKDSRTRRFNFDFEAYTIDITDGPQGQPLSIIRFPVTFKEASNPSRSLYFSHYFSWMGKLREIMVQPICEKLVKWFSTGKWGLVTNLAETKIYGEAKPGDIIEAHQWLDNVTGKEESTMELCFEWHKISNSGERDLIAVSKMSTSWVAIHGHGVVEVRPFPEFGKEFVRRMLPPIDSRHRTQQARPLEKSITTTDLGKKLFEMKAGPIKQSSLLKEKIFETSLEDANLVGNIYFSNYYKWQGRVRDLFINELAAKHLRDKGQQGELRCTFCKINHLNEAMPFARILVRMHRQAVFERGARFYFDYYRVAEDGSRQKLGFGEHHAVWHKPNEQGKWVPTKMPSFIHTALIPYQETNILHTYQTRFHEKRHPHDAVVVDGELHMETAADLLEKQDEFWLSNKMNKTATGMSTGEIMSYSGKELSNVSGFSDQNIFDFDLKDQTAMMRQKLGT